MGQRKIGLRNGEYYHIYNRGVDKREIFLCDDDYYRFLRGMKEFNDNRPAWRVKKNLLEVSPRFNRGETSSDKFVGIVAYCLNPNHFHFILRQEKDGGITEFMRKLGGYTMYFNKKHHHSGVIFQGSFQSAHIDSNEYLLYLSAYVNMNYQIHGYGNIENWPYSSYADYAGKRKGRLCDKDIILNQFGNDCDEYKNFMRLNADYIKIKKDLED